jgi:ComF family protein
VCAACARVLDHPLDGPVCTACWDAVLAPPPPLCDRCGDPLTWWRMLGDARCSTCRRRPGAVDAACAAALYEGAMRGILHAFTYEARQSLAGPLGARMRAAGATLLATSACVVPVPLHPWRRLGRGFNQAAALAGELGLPVVHALWRRRATRPQAGLTAPARRANLRRAFAPAPWLGRTRQALISGQVVVLVDDVRTTGATLDACARMLRAAGAREVRALTAAVAVMK